MSGPLQNANLVNRFVAKSLDFVIMIMITYPIHLVFAPLADFIALVYILSADAFPEGRSLGKRMLHLKTTHFETHRICHLKQSIIRNIPFGLLVFFAVIPPAIGYFFIFFVALPLIALEIYFLVALDSKRRLGDVIADTVVVEAFDKDPDRL